MWATTATPAANSIDISAGRLGDWMRLGRYEIEGVRYPFWDPNTPEGMQGRRLYPSEWLEAVAPLIRKPFDPSKVPASKRISYDA